VPETPNNAEDNLAALPVASKDKSANSVGDIEIAPTEVSIEERLNYLRPVLGRISQVNRLSPTALAYIGDAVFELYIRAYYLLPPQRSPSYHNRVVTQVRAEAQVRHLRSLSPHLTPSELEILRRGRNATRNAPKRLDLATYQTASSFETLIGYLYITDPQRLTQLLGFLDLDRE
jgi:ribonuclease III family protein